MVELHVWVRVTIAHNEHIVPLSNEGYMFSSSISQNAIFSLFHV